MVDATVEKRREFFRRREDITDRNTNKFLYEALEQNKREGLVLAVKTRIVSLVIIGAFLVYLMPEIPVLYYEALIVGFALIGLAQLSIGRVGRSRAELFLIMLDLALMTVVLVVPNPLDHHPWSIGMQYKFGNFPYFFVLLAGAALAYSWRTLFAVALYTSVLWMGAYYWAIHQDPNLPELSAQIGALIKDYPDTFKLLDPNAISFEARLQEILVFCIVAGILALNSWRANRLLVRQADAMRGRANLARHFPPNIVDNLALSDQPLGAVRAQPVAVLFADIVGFTRMAEDETPERIVEVLREFHARMEEAVFENKGTLDKFLGDGLMATFGTPETSPDDARNALRCAQAMHNQMRDWNYLRKRDGLQPIRLSVGIHYGIVVMGDIGSERRLEYAVLGDVVNVASRLEALTRELNAYVVVSAELVEAAGGPQVMKDMGYLENGLQTIRGREDTVQTWLQPLAQIKSATG